MITTYTGKGVYPEDDPKFLGVAGGSLPPGARKALEASDAVLALGADLDGLSTGNWSFPLGDRLVHVTTDVGGFRLWAMQAFETYEPEQLVAAGSWAGMGVGLPAAIGAKLANPDAPVVCLSGDGGLLMCIHELATAAEEDLDIVLVVSNNADYGIISRKPQIRDIVDDHAFTWASPDFPTIAEGFGWAGEAVADADGLESVFVRERGRTRPGHP